MDSFACSRPFLLSVVCQIVIAAAVLGCLLVASAATGAVASQVRISQVGPDGNPSFAAGAPATAYDPQANRYLVVWHGNDSPGEGNEIHGRFVGADGSPLGGEFRISDLGPDFQARFDALRPSVAYDPRMGEYLVVWYGDDAVDNEFEIYGQRLSAAGAEVGVNDFRISQTGTADSPNFDASRPALAYNSVSDEYLVTWYGDAAGRDEFEIYGQRLSAAGAEVGVNDFRISDLGPGGNASFDALRPAVVHASRTNEYLVTWYGDNVVDGEHEIYGQRLSAAGAEVGVNDFRISTMGPGGNANFNAARSAVTYNPTTNEYLVVWDGDDNTAARIDNEFEIYGQRLTAAGAEVGASDFRISTMGPTGGGRFDALRPAAAYDARANEYLVVWRGDDVVDGEFEIYGQRLSGAAAEVGVDDFRISEMGPNGHAGFGAEDPALAYSVKPTEYLAVWSGDDDARPLVRGEYEIFGRRAVIGGVGGGGAGADKRRPRLRLKARKRQRIVRRRAVIAYAVSDERISLRATARLSLRKGRPIKLKGIQRVVRADRRTKLRFRLSRKARRVVRRNLRGKRRVLARITVRVTDAAGNSTTAKVRVRARP